MEIDCDKEHGMVYVKLRDGKVVSTQKMVPGLYVDIDADGKPVGVEIDRDALTEIAGLKFVREYKTDEQ